MGLTFHGGQEVLFGNEDGLNPRPGQAFMHLHQLSLGENVVGWPEIQRLVQRPRVVDGLDPVCPDVILVHKDRCKKNIYIYIAS